MELLGERISQSVNELGLQIDNLYKLSQKERQRFLNRIQTLKTTLLALKSSLRNTNKQHIQNQYKGIRTEIKQLRRQLQVLLEEQKIKNANKQNRSMHQNIFNVNSKDFGKNRSTSQNNQALFQASSESLFRNNPNAGRIGVMKHISKKQYEDLMINIVEKTQLNNQLSEQVQKLRQQNQTLKYFSKARQQKLQERILDEKTLEFTVSQLKYKLSQFSKIVAQKQEQIDVLRQQNLQITAKQDRSLLEISQLKIQLDIAQQKLLNFQNLGQINICKTSILQQSLQKYEKQVILLNHQSQQILNDLQRNKFFFAESEYKLMQSMKKIAKLQLKLQNQGEDIQVLENELGKSQTKLYELKIQKENTQTNSDLEKKILFKKSQEDMKQITTCKQIILDCQKVIALKQEEYRYLEQRLLQCEKLNLLLRQETKQLRQKLHEKENQFSEEINLYICDIELKQIQINKLCEQVRKSLQLTKVLQQQIQNVHQNQYRMKQNRKSLSTDLKQVQIKNIQLNQTYEELRQKYHAACKNLNIKDQEIQNIKNRNYTLELQLKQTKNRLHKAKIQAIQDIRTNFF